MTKSETHTASVRVIEKTKDVNGGHYYKVEYMGRLEPTFSGHWADDGVIGHSTFARTIDPSVELEVGNLVNLSYGSVVTPRFGKINGVLGLRK